jgi:hypothetical protein
VDKVQIDLGSVGKPMRVGDRRNPALDSMRDLIVETQVDPTILGGAPLEIMAHSQGGAITSAGLYDASNTLRTRPGGAETLSNVRVTSLNGAAQEWIDGPQYEHVVHLRDFVGMDTGIGRSRNIEGRVGKGATVVAYSNNPNQPGPAFVWREIRHSGGRPTGWGVPEEGRVALSEYHGVDQTLGMYRQRMATTDDPPCPENLQDDAPPPVCT